MIILTRIGMIDFFQKNALLITLISGITSIGSLLSSLVGVFDRSVGLEKTLLIISITFFCISVTFLLLYLLAKNRLKKSTIVIEGLTINGLNQSNRYKADSKGTELIEAVYRWHIEGSDSNAYVEHKTKFREDLTEFPFRASADVHNNFADMNCYGYDLNEDPKRLRKIPAKLVSADDGSFKKINVPLIKPVTKGNIAHVALQRKTKGCMSASKDYLTIMHKIKGGSVKLKVELTFTGIKPRIINAYEVQNNGKYKFLSQMNLKLLNSKLVAREEYKKFDSKNSLVYIYTV